MSIIELAFPASFLQLGGQQHVSEFNAMKAKCSDVGYISTNLKNRTKETLEDAEAPEKLLYNRYKEKASDDHVELSRHGLVSNISILNEPTEITKKKRKKKNKKKEDLNKLTLDSNDDFDSQACPSIQSGHKEVACRTSAIISSQSSKEVIVNSVEKKIATDNSICSQSIHSLEDSRHLVDYGDTLPSDIPVLQDLTSSHNKVDILRNTELEKKKEKNSESDSSSADIRPTTACEPMGACLQYISGCKTTLTSDIVSSEISVSWDSASGHTKVEKISNMEWASKQDRDSERVPSSVDVKSTTALKSMGACLQDAGVCGTTLSAELTLMGSDILPPYGDQKINWNHRNGSNLAACDNFSTEWNPDVADTSNSMEMAIGVKEVIGDDDSKKVKLSKRCSLPSDTPTAAPSQAVEHDKWHSRTLYDASRMPSRATNHYQTGKENSHFNWQETWRNIGGLQTSGRKRFNHDHLWMEPSPPVQLVNDLGTDRLIPPPQLSFTVRDGFRERVQNQMFSGREMLRMRRHVLEESPEVFARRKFHSRIGHYVSRSKENLSGSTTCGRPIGTMNHSTRQESFNFCKRRFWTNRVNLSKPQYSSNFVHRVASEVPSTMNLCSTISGERSSHANYYGKSDYFGKHEFGRSPSFFARPHFQLHEQSMLTSGHHKILHEIQPHIGAKIPTSLAKEDSSSTCFGTNFTSNNNFRECINSKLILQKWIPICKKEPVIVNGKVDTDANDMRKVNGNMEICHTSVCNAASVTKASNRMKQPDRSSSDRQANHLGGKIDHSASDYKAEMSSMHFSSEMPIQTPDASFRLLITSEKDQFATDSPIAEFEKLLCSFSPVIAPLLVHQKHVDVIRHYPISNSFSEFQNHTLLLRNVWTWYEEPGNYGLQVKARDSQNSKLETDTLSFSAYFVPLLSAVQLFRRSKVRSTDVLKRGRTEQHSISSSPRNSPISNLKSLGKYIKHSSLATSKESGYSNPSSGLLSSDDSEVIFEYFECEPPKDRMPLYEKIKELVKDGAYNPHVHGNPSILESTNLQDLHPTSWYSVAWYPICRIPEGSFRACFLTYHSLGNLTFGRSNSPEKNAFSVVVPVLGLQSYNAQDECWFRPKNKNPPAVSRLEDGTQEVEMLKERLRSLEETAALFARGTVCKDHIHASNMHPDYEFFLTRRHS